MGLCGDLLGPLPTLTSDPGALPIFRVVPGWLQKAWVGFSCHLFCVALDSHFLQDWPQPWAVKEPASLPLSRSFLRTAPPHVRGPRRNPRLGKLVPILPVTVQK